MIFLTQTLVRNYEVDQYKGAKTSRKNYHLEVTPIFLSEIIYLHTQTRNLTTDYDQNNWRLIAGLGSVTPPAPPPHTHIRTQQPQSERERAK